MTRTIVSLVLAVHGLIHLLGFVVPWRLADVRGFPRETTALNGRIELGEFGARAVGVAWLVAALAFVALAVGVWRRMVWVVPVGGTAAALSLVLCVLAAPRANAGLAVDVAVLLAVLYLGLNGSAVAGWP